VYRGSNGDRWQLLFDSSNQQTVVRHCRMPLPGRQTTLGHHLDQIPEAQLKAKIPPHAEYDNLAFNVPSFE
jgi:hypothetical protein